MPRRRPAIIIRYGKVRNRAIHRPTTERKVSMERDAWHVYLVECADGTLYCGIAKDPVKRLAEHNGILPGGAKYTRGRRPVVLLTSVMCANKSAAVKMERAIKSRPREEKLSFMQNGKHCKGIASKERVPCMNFVALDLETANPQVSSICQVGIAEYASGSLVSEWETLVNPLSGFDPFNIGVHGITAATVTSAPILPEIYEDLVVRLRGNIVVSHTPFDRIALTRALQSHGLPPIACTWLDSSVVARRAWPQFARRGYGLKNLCDFLGYEFSHHNALADALAAGHIMLAACRHTGMGIEDWCSGACHVY